MKQAADVIVCENVTKNMTDIDFFKKELFLCYYRNSSEFYLHNGKVWSKNMTENGKSIFLNAAAVAERSLIFIKNLKSNGDKFTCVEDFSKVELGGLCYNIQLIRDDYDLNLSHSVCINVSLLIPFFHIHVLELKRKKENFAKWNGSPKRIKKLESKEYLKEITEIKQYLHSDLGLTEFPDYLTGEVVSGIYTEDIREEDFTYYNAFFQREFYTR